MASGQSAYASVSGAHRPVPASARPWGYGRSPCWCGQPWSPESADAPAVPTPAVGDAAPAL